ncbi:hypothetical protein [Streptomyces sp. NPDC001315]|uniref:hypothetical protein n=1 Tax=Streptomyces sp. NPDC001315 TaxID=3364562 RepID=UPI00368D1C8D
MPTRHTARPHSRLLLTATALLAAAALLRIVSPDDHADARPVPHHGPTHSTTPTKSPHPTRHPSRAPRSTSPTTDSANDPTHTESQNDPTPTESENNRDDKPHAHPTASRT